MSLRDLRDDFPRLLALTDVLCAAAASDDYAAKEELAIVHDTLLEVLGSDELPPEVAAHIANFDYAAFDVAGALRQLALQTQEERQALLDRAFDIVKADRMVDSGELGFIGELAGLLGLPLPAPLR